MKKTKYLAILAIVFATAFILAACKVEVPAQSSPQPMQPAEPAVVNVYEAEEKEVRVINVNGSGKAMLKPDIATFYVQVSTENEKADKAQEENSLIMAAVMETLKQNGVDEKDIATEYINLDQRYDYNKSPAKIVGYIMINRIKVTIRNIDSLGKVMGDTISAGATGTSGLSFSVSSNSEGYAEALKNATEDASIKAQAIAKALGVTLEVVPVSVNEQSNSYTPYVTEWRSANDLASVEAPYANAAPAEVSVGDLEVNAMVSVTYAIANP